MTQCLQQVVVHVIFNVLFNSIKCWQPYVDPRDVLENLTRYKIPTVWMPLS